MGFEEAYNRHWDKKTTQAKLLYITLLVALGLLLIPFAILARIEEVIINE